MNDEKKRVVLYADDDQDDLGFVCDAFALAAPGIEVKTFPDGGAILTFLSGLQATDLPCLIILDINMPILSGKEVLVRIRQHAVFAALPVVLFTTSSQEADKVFAHSHNARFITKPLNLGQMEAIIQDFLSFSRQEA